ncbi:MAG: helix-turn-helix transcriptional regulator, partial [Coriobacteriaceae bacterium]|nr:helix-turn-helix transcriptional regulator [Coriobacteriaceae bacterium]
MGDQTGRGWTQRQSALCTVVGAACLWAWGYVANLSTALFPRADVVASIGIEYAYYASQLTLALAAVILIGMLRRRHPVLSPALVLAAGMCLAGASGTIFLLMGLPAGPQGAAGWLGAAIIACGVVYGAAGLVLTVAWGARFSLGSRSMRQLVLLSFLLGYIIYLAIPVLPSRVSTLVACLLPLVSAALWLLDSWRRHQLTGEVWPQERMPGEASAGLVNADILPWRAMALFSVTALIGNFVTSLLMGSSYTGAQVIFPGGFLVCCCITAVALIAVSQGGLRLDIELLYRYCLPFSVLGMLLLLVAPDRSGALAGALVTGASLFLQVLVILKVTESTQQTGASPLLAFSVGQGLVGSVVFSGNAGGRVASELPGAGEAVLPLACAIGVFALFYLLVLTTDGLARRVAKLEGARKTGDEDGATSPDASGDGRPSPQVATAGTKAASASTIFAGASSPAAAAAASTPADAASAEALRLDSFAQTLGLTPREAEVCRYLVQGRSLPFIAEQLYVTAGTVKTHAIHIYRKAGVTSKQELISLFG